MVARMREGEVDFTIPSTGQKTKTWYRISGSLSPNVVPLIILHGGPGACSDYLWPLEALTEQYGITTVNYDQIGNGRSTHLRERAGDAEFWTEDLFIAEMENLLEKLGITGQYDILGHSWGGMLGARYAISQPPRLRKLIISNSPADMKLWIESCNRLRAGLPQDVQDVLDRHEKDGTTDSPEYSTAVLEFYKKHMCRIWPFPKPVADSLGWLEEDPTTYGTMCGPSEFLVTGSLKHWTVLDGLHEIKVPTLIFNGQYDEAQDSTVKPFQAKIPQATWVPIEDASHMSHIEKPDFYLKHVGAFLAP